MSFVEVLDIHKIDELAKAQLLWYVDPPYGPEDEPRPYTYDGGTIDVGVGDLPSDYAAIPEYAGWRYFILVED